MSKVLDLWSDMTGVVLDYALKTPPSPGWMLCFGQALVPGNATTARLRQKLIDDGFPHGKDGSNNPLLPDVRGRVSAGPDNMGGTAAGRLTASSGVAATGVGATGGSETHTLTAAQMPAHNHGVNEEPHTHGITDPGHNHAVSDPGHAHGGVATPGQMLWVNGAVYYNMQATGAGSTAAAGTGISVQGAATGISAKSASTGISTQNAGTSEAHLNVQPTLVLNKIIRL